MNQLLMKRLLLKGLSDEILGGGGQKWHQLIGLPLSYQCFAVHIYFIGPLSGNSRKTVQRKLIQIY
jgi:hypothetical protein